MRVSAARAWRRAGGGLPLLGVLLATLLLPPVAPTPVLPPSYSRPLVGFSYSARVAANFDIDALPGLERLLDSVHPDLVRLPVYWDEVEPAPGQFDFSLLDGELNLIAAHNRADRRHPPARVVLVVGVRNLATPEAYIPEWLAAGGLPPSLAEVAALPVHRQYMETVFERYYRNRLLYAWQVENEPLDDVESGYPGHVDLGAGVLDSEIALLRALDTRHQVLVTTYNSARLNLDEVGASFIRPLLWYLPVARPTGHPADALAHGDVLGLDLYVYTAQTPLNQATVAQRIAWKQETLAFWATRAAGEGKELWITEMQAEPWAELTGFGTDDLLLSARAYRGQGAYVTLLWGVEYWLASPDWMATGLQSVAILRGSAPPAP